MYVCVWSVSIAAATLPWQFPCVLSVWHLVLGIAGAEMYATLFVFTRKVAKLRTTTTTATRAVTTNNYMQCNATLRLNIWQWESTSVCSSYSAQWGKSKKKKVISCTACRKTCCANDYAKWQSSSDGKRECTSKRACVSEKERERKEIARLMLIVRNVVSFYGSLKSWTTVS